MYLLTPWNEHCPFHSNAVHSCIITRATIRYERFEITEIRHRSKSATVAIVHIESLWQRRNISALRCPNAKNDGACLTSPWHTVPRSGSTHTYTGKLLSVFSISLFLVSGRWVIYINSMYGILVDRFLYEIRD